MTFLDTFMAAFMANLMWPLLSGAANVLTVLTCARLRGRCLEWSDVRIGLVMGFLPPAFLAIGIMVRMLSSSAVALMTPDMKLQELIGIAAQGVLLTALWLLVSGLFLGAGFLRRHWVIVLLLTLMFMTPMLVHIVQCLNTQ